MRKALTLTALTASLLLPAAAPALAQGRKPPVDQVKLGQQFFAQEEKCRGLLREKRWKEAEPACRAAVQLSEGFADQRELEKMSAHAAVGHALMGQERFKEAAESYVRAVEASRPRLHDKNAEVGDMYFNVAVAYHMLRDFGAARGWYRKAETTYRAAISGISEEEAAGSEPIAEMKSGYRKALKRFLEYHLRAAEEAGDEADIKEVTRQLAELP